MAKECGRKSRQKTTFGDWKHAYISNTEAQEALSTWSMWGAPNDPAVSHRTSDVLHTTSTTSVHGNIYPPCRRLFQLCSGHRWGYFPSASVGWNVTNEKFMEPGDQRMDYLKIRASWGRNGNCAIDNFQYLSTIAIGGSNYFFGSPDKGRRDHRLEPRPPCKYRYNLGKNRSSSTSASTHASSTAVSASPSTGTARLLATGSCRLLSFCRTIAALPYM